MLLLLNLVPDFMAVLFISLQFSSVSHQNSMKSGLTEEKRRETKHPALNFNLKYCLVQKEMSMLQGSHGTEPARSSLFVIPYPLLGNTSSDCRA